MSSDRKYKAKQFGKILDEWIEAHKSNKSRQQAIEDLSGNLRESIDADGDEDGAVSSSWLIKIVTTGQQPRPSVVRAFSKISGLPLRVLYEAAGYPQADAQVAGEIYAPLLTFINDLSMDEQQRMYELVRGLRGVISG